MNLESHSTCELEAVELLYLQPMIESHQREWLIDGQRHLHCRLQGR